MNGVTTLDFLRSAMNVRREEGDEISLMQFIKEMDEALDFLDIDKNMAQRYLNEGFSGGEKKRNEILQLLLLKPEIGILDEIDSGLDIDALKVVSKGINKLRDENFGTLIITHYQRLLDYITPDFVHVMMQGRVVKSGGPELAQRLEKEGYEWIKEEYGIEDETVGQEGYIQSISDRRVNMAVETKLPYDKDYIEQFSASHNEPAWMKDLRLKAFEQSETLDMPKP